MTNPVSDSIFLDAEFVHHLRSLMAQQALLETGANGVAIALKEGSEYVCRATAGAMAPTIGVRLQNDTGITAACIRSAQPVVCHDAAGDERVNAVACKELGIQSIVVVPVTNRGAVVGIIEALSARASAFGSTEQAALQKIAQEIDEVWTAGAVTDAGSLVSPIEVDEETPDAETERPCDLLSYAYQESPTQRHRWNFAEVVAPVMMICALSLGLFLIFGRAANREPTADEKLSIQLSTLPLSRGPKFDLSPRIPPASENQPATPLPATLQPASLKDSGSSIRELEASAQAGNASAQVRLANALSSGVVVAADPVSAEAWYIVAHLAGSAEATSGMKSLSQRLSNSQTAAVRERLAMMYWKGIGVKPDRTTAYFWLTVAEAAGAQDIGESKQRLAHEMRDSQVADANLRAQQWLLQHHQLVTQNWN